METGLRAHGARQASFSLTLAPQSRHSVLGLRFNDKGVGRGDAATSDLNRQVIAQAPRYAWDLIYECTGSGVWIMVWMCCIVISVESSEV